jgi:hypothetical protein
MEAMIDPFTILPGTGRGTIRRMVEGKGSSDLSTVLRMVPLRFREQVK